MSTSATLITFMYPLRAKTAYTETLNDELCVYEWTRYEVHALNATAASVWQLCDGKTSVAEESWIACGRNCRTLNTSSRSRWRNSERSNSSTWTTG